MKTIRNKSLAFPILIVALLVAGALLINAPRFQTGGQQTYDGQRSWKDIAYQLNLGPRTPGSAAHQQIVDWIVAELKINGWTAEVQSGTIQGHPYQNIIGKRGTSDSAIILGAHYDTRMVADQDPDPSKRTLPVPGANDGASGVAVLLELARTLPTTIHTDVWLVFFDIEDQGDIPGWDWILGSQAYADSLTTSPKAVVVVDMIGDTNLNIYKEKTSNADVVKQIWDTAAQAGYSAQFIDQYKYSMLDDHTPFLQRGFPAVDLIDFDYPYWHTTSDTVDKVSPDSLKVVGDTLTKWILSK